MYIIHKLFLNFILIIGIETRFAVYEQETSLLIASCTIPFFKLRWISDNDERENAIRLLKQELELLSLSSLVPATIVKNSSICSSVSDDFFSFPSETPTFSIDTELALYLSDPETSLTALHRFPHIKKLF